MTEYGLQCALEASYPNFTLHLSLSVRKGELACVIGPSGCGKSTTLSLISGLLPIGEGSIILDGRDITGLPTEKRQIALVFQDYALFPQMDAGENIGYSMKIRGMGRRERASETMNLLDLVSLPGFQKRKPSALSGGERQRVALARALASKPKLLLLDEPLSALDSRLRRHLREEIRRIHDETGVTMLYVTHDQNEAMAIADTIIVMRDGRIEQTGSPEELYLNPQTLFSASFMGEGTILPYKVIAETLVSEGNNYVRFTPKSGDQVIFFRPETVVIQEDSHLPFPEFLPHLEFRESRLRSCIFQGALYEAQYLWKGNTIKVLLRGRPKSDVATLGVRLTNIRQYLDGEFVSRS